MEKTRKLLLFNHDYGTGSFYKCFMAESAAQVEGLYPEFKYVSWEECKLPADGIARIKANAFDIEDDPSKDDVLKEIAKYREEHKRRF